MSTTDRSLWVEDKYALRCRGCGEKFTVFRRRHHCRRCGQVFCYECLHPASAASTSQSIVSNVYQWFTPTASSDAGPLPSVTPEADISDRSFKRRTSATTNTAAELSVRLCRRCAATIIENAAREALVPHADFQPSSLTLQSAPFVASTSPSPLLLSRSLPCTAPTLPGTPLHLGSRRGQLNASQHNVTPMPQNPPVPVAPPRETAVAADDDVPAAAATLRFLETSAVRHVETTEDREVTYSIGRVHRPAPPAKLQWWEAQRKASAEGKAARPRLDAQAVTRTDTLEAVGARLQTLSEPIEFSARFLLADDVVQLSMNADAGPMGSAAVHAVVDPPARLREFLHECSAACSTHLQTRIQHSLQSYLTQVRGARLSKHLADVAWHVVRQTSVALGATALDHVAVISIAAAAMPAQCAVYPGLVNRRPLPSKRVMTACDHPRVLLLAGHLSYSVQPAEDLVDYVRSYSGYLDKLFQRLVVWRPDVVVVEGGMHHYLRERIEEDGHMRLVLNVGRDFLVQLSWCLRADIIADLQYVGVGDLATPAPMGHCARFDVLELAEEVHCCGFRGFDALTFHTVILRGGRVAGSVAARDTPSLARQWEVLEKVAKEAVTVAYHLALQSHGALALVRDGAPLPVLHNTEITTEEAAVAAAITMNAGCRFPAAVHAACRGLASPAALATLKDNLVVNVVHMDQLYEGGGGTIVGRSAAVAAATAVMGTLTKSRSSDLAQERGGSRGSLPLSHGGSHLDLSSPTAGSPTSAAAAAAAPGPAGPLLSAAPSRPEAVAANAYAVVQQKSALAFYGSGDETLFHFLVSRCSGAEVQVLYLHGGFRVKVTAATHAALPAAPGRLAECGLGGLLGAAQTTAFHKAAVRQHAARALAGVEAMDAAAMAAFVAHLKGFFSLRIRAEHAGVDPSDVTVPLDASVEVCAPHLLSLSTAAFLEWVLYSWMPALAVPAASAPATSPTLRITFQFHPLGADLQSPRQPQQQQPSHGHPNSLAVQAHTNTVTFLIEPVQLGAVEYPPRVLPSAASSQDAHDLDGRLAVDTLYAAQEASELATLLAELLQAAHTSLQRAEQLESAKAAVSAPAQALPPSTASSVEDVPGKAPPGSPSTAAGAALLARPQALVQLETAAVALRQCMVDAESALAELQEARPSSVGPPVAPVLARLRQRLLPAFVAAYRAWRNAHRRAVGRNAISAAAAGVVGGGADVTAGTGGGNAAALQERPPCLRQLDGCLYHADRSQWIRLAEPTSILAAALLQLYRPTTPTDSTGTPAPPPPATATTTTVKEPVSPAPSTAASDSAAGADGETKPALTPTVTAATQAAHVSFAIEPPPVAESPQESPSPPGRWGQPPSLASVCRLTRAAALEALRQTSRVEAAAPSATLKCAVTGYQPLVHDSGGGAMAALSSATGVSAIMNSGGATEPSITVEVLFPRSFAALHVLYTDGAPFDLCAALLRCRPYSADGGKSQSRFFVTQDGRFLIKAVKPTEMRYFREWAPRYFARMADYFAAAAPEPRQDAPRGSEEAPLHSLASSMLGAQSTLGKILGLYTVHVQGTRSRGGAPVSAASADATASQLSQRPLLPDGTHCFMVAEQLLFGRPVRETWDLKGSQRNRTTDQTAAVRLDEDLVQEHLRAGNFFFCSPESKSLLMDHLSRDTALLAESGIMDYSLMVSVGDAGRLYVGMIDFLHPYSSAKVLESKMKSGLDTMLGYTRRDPTIIDPASYAARFMLWMDGYFNGVPDRLFPVTRVRLLKERRESELADKKRQSPLSAP